MKWTCRPFIALMVLLPAISPPTAVTARIQTASTKQVLPKAPSPYTRLRVDITYDHHPEETEWALINEHSGATVYSSEGKNESAGLVQEVIDNSFGAMGYRFIITDYGGDGICKGRVDLYWEKYEEWVHLVGTNGNFLNGTELAFVVPYHNPGDCSAVGNVSPVLVKVHTYNSQSVDYSWSMSAVNYITTMQVQGEGTNVEHELCLTPGVLYTFSVDFPNGSYCCRLAGCGFLLSFVVNGNGYTASAGCEFDGQFTLPFGEPTEPPSTLPPEDHTLVTVHAMYYDFSTYFWTIKSSNGIVVAARTLQGEDTGSVLLPSSGTYTLSVDFPSPSFCCIQGLCYYSVSAQVDGVSVELGGACESDTHFMLTEGSSIATASLTAKQTKVKELSAEEVPQQKDTRLSPPPSTRVRVDIVYDEYPEEIDWAIKQGDTIIFRKPQDTMIQTGVTSVSVDLNGTIGYTFVITDSDDDGLCKGRFDISWEKCGEWLHLTGGDGNFQSDTQRSFTVPFHISGDCEAALPPNDPRNSTEIVIEMWHYDYSSYSWSVTSDNGTVIVEDTVPYGSENVYLFLNSGGTYTLSVTFPNNGWCCQQGFCHYNVSTIVDDSPVELESGCEYATQFTVPEASAPPIGFQCFAGNSLVEVENKGSVQMRMIEIGDRVRVSDKGFEPIYSFGHYDPKRFGDFMEIGLSSSKSPLAVSEYHMIFVPSRGFVAASSLTEGDTLIDGGTGEILVVETIKQHVTLLGVFAPFTSSGTIVVNDVLASSFITFSPSSSTFGMFGGLIDVSYQWLEHTFEFPHRLVCHYLGKCSIETYDEEGVSTWNARPFEVIQLVMKSPSLVVQNLLMTLAFAVMVVFYVTESCLLNPLDALAGVMAVYVAAYSFGLLGKRPSLSHLSFK